VFWCILIHFLKFETLSTLKSIIDGCGLYGMPGIIPVMVKSGRKKKTKFMTVHY